MEGLQGQNKKKIPVILDTDLGDWIDDHFALTFLLNSPELEVKLITTTYGDTQTRAHIIAKILSINNSTNIPVAIGQATQEKQDFCCQRQWIHDFDVKNYKGVILPDAASAIVDTIMKSEQAITLIAIGPMLNISQALHKQPDIASKTNFVAQMGSIGSACEIFASWNVVCHLPAAHHIFSANWKSVIIAPYDVAKRPELTGSDWQSVKNSKSPLTQALIHNHELFRKTQNNYPDHKCFTLFDTVAVYLAFADEWLVVEELGVVIDHEGYTRFDNNSKRVKIATEFKNFDAFMKLLTSRLI